MKYIQKFLLISVIISGCVLSRQIPLSQNTLIVSGKLESDTVWQGLIEVEDKIIVPEGITPGAIVRFQKKGYKQFGFGDNRIYVQKGGKIIAEGNNDNYIIFTSAEKKPQISDWHGIEFHSENNLSVLNYCKVEYAYEAIACIFSSPSISKNIITNNDKGICLWQKSDPLISQNNIKNNKTGILCSNKSNPNIISNIISNNKDSGISCEKGSSVTIFENEINNNFNGIKMSLDVAANIDKNVIKKNEYGIQQLTVASAIIRRNIIEENKYGIFSLRKSFVNINKNLINKNEYGLFLFERTKGIIENNNIIKNKYGIYCGKTSNIEILYNNITENKIGIFCEHSSYPKINYNNIIGQSDYYYSIKLGENQSFEWTKKVWPKEEVEEWEKKTEAGFVDATHNYWGNIITSIFNKKEYEPDLKNIYDYYDKEFCIIEGTEYERDKVDCKNWEKNEINGAGIINVNKK